MVIFVVTRNGYEEMKSLIISAQYPVWIGAGVLSDREIDAIRTLGVELTNFTYTVAPDDRYQVECALETIDQHHPGQRVWCERIASDA